MCERKIHQHDLLSGEKLFLHSCMNMAENDQSSTNAIPVVLWSAERCARDNATKQTLH